MARVTIKDPRLKTSLNPAIVQLRGDGWVSSIKDKDDQVTDDTEALVGDITRGGMTANQRTFAGSTSEKYFLAERAAKKIEIEERTKEADAKEKNVLNSRMLTAEVAILKREAVKNFLLEALFSEQESDEEARVSVDKIFTFYNQDMTAFVKHAISSEMQMPHITSEEGIQFMPSTDMRKTTSDWMINEEGELCLQTRMGIRLIDSASDDVERNKIGIEVPGEISWQFVLTPVGFKLNYIDFSNSLLQDLCLGTAKEIDLTSRIIQAEREEIANSELEEERNDFDSELSEDSELESEDDIDFSEDNAESDSEKSKRRVVIEDEPTGITGFIQNRISSIYGQFISTYTMVYSPDGFDPVLKKLNGKNIQHGRAIDFYYHPLTLITSFLGLPNGNPTIHDDVDENTSVQSIGNLFWRLLSWDDNQAIGLNVLRAPIAAAFHLLMVIPKFIVNIAKLITEFLPTLASQIAGKIARNIGIQLERQVNREEKNYAAIIGWGALYGATKTIEFAFKTMNFVGRAITSPILNMRSAWYGGDQLGHWLADQLGAGKNTKKIIRAVMANTFSLFTGALTVAIYAIAAPIGAKIALGTILPQAPGVIGVAIKAVIPIISTVANAVGGLVMPVAGPVLNALGLTLSPLALIGTAVLTSVMGNEAAKGLKNVTGRAVDKIASWFRKPAVSEENRAPVSEPAVRPRKTVNRQASAPREVPSQRNSQAYPDWHHSQASSPSHNGMFHHIDSPKQEPDSTENETDKPKHSPKEEH